MASRGQDETERLKAQIHNQLDRLVTQLKDCDEFKEDLEPDEYEEVKQVGLREAVPVRCHCVETWSMFLCTFFVLPECACVSTWCVRAVFILVYV